MAKEKKIRDIDVEPCCKVAEMLPILPHCIGTEAMDEKQRGLGMFVDFGDPTMHDCAIPQICSDRREACIGEGIAVEPIP